MRDISLSEPTTTDIPRYTILNYGDTRTGKTFFGATMIRPFIIADAVESGYLTVKNMDRSWWFEPDVEPIVVAIEQMSDFAALMPRIDQLIATGRIHSIVFDAFSFYTDLYLNGLIMAQTKTDMRQAYGALGIHLRQVRTSVHSRKASVLWNCLAKHPDADDPKGRPLIPGQSADKFSAGVDFLVHSQSEPIREGGKVVAYEHRIRTRSFGSYIVGNRLGARADELPDPFVGNYEDFLKALGHDTDAIRRALPKIGAAPKPIVTVKPPPVVTKTATNVSAAPKVIPSASNNQAPRGAVNKQ